jgi:adenylylsulfate reductase subunit B
MYICPQDLMKYDAALTKAYNQEPDLCWECYSCVKTCPQSAISMRGYADVVPLGGMLQPMRGTDSIMWTAKYRSGETKRFKFAIRTTPWGSIEPYKEAPTPPADQLKGSQLLYGEPKYLMADLPSPSKK